MGALLTQSSTMLCPHGGTISATVAGSPRATANNDPILAETDTFMIAGCPFMMGSSPHPCVSLRWTSAATAAQASGAKLLTDSSQGLCIAADQAPQGPPNLVAAQAKATAT